MKNKLKIHLKLGILFLGISLLLWNCEKEQTIEHTHDSSATSETTFKRLSIHDLNNDLVFSNLSKNYLSDFLENEGIVFKSSSDNIIITSDTINIVEKENYLSYTIRIKRPNKSFSTENLILEEKNGHQRAYILSYEFTPDWTLDYVNGIKSRPKGKVYATRYNPSDLKSKIIQKSTNNCYWVDIYVTYPCGCGHYSRPPCTGSTCGGRLYPERERTSVYVCDDQGDGTELFSTDSSDEGFGGGGGSGSGSGDSSESDMNMEDTSELIAHGVESNIDYSNLDPCSSGIMSELKNLQSNDIKNIIHRFGAPDAIYNWNVVTVTLENPDLAGSTDWLRNSDDNAIDYNYLSQISPNFTNTATEIAIARVLLHELLHAYILSHIDDVQNGNTSEFITFRELWRMIQKDLTGFNNNPEPVHHEFMAQKFIIPLKDALKEWDDSAQSNQYYEDLAWGALIDTDTFDELHPIGSASRNRIINTNAAEDKNLNQNGISPKGTPCQ